MQRKTFIKSVMAAAAVPVIKSFPAFSSINSAVKPPALKKGDTIGLIAPGSYITDKELKDSIGVLGSLGFKTTFTENILKQNGYFSAIDSERRDDIHQMFSDKKVKAIICARGGYGCARLLPLLDYKLIADNPKVFIGYSDVTALLYGIYAQTGLVTFHGPVGISSYNSFTQKYFFETLMKGTGELSLISEAESDKQEMIINSGICEGELAGGNLSVINSLIGTSYDIDLSGKILFLEEIGEEPYRIDRMLTQLIQSGKLDKASGIAMGVFKDCEPKTVNPSFENSFTLAEVLFDRLSSLKIPVIYGLSFGHIKNKFTLPLGIIAELNTFTKTIRLLERAVG